MDNETVSIKRDFVDLSHNISSEIRKCRERVRSLKNELSKIRGQLLDSSVSDDCVKLFLQTSSQISACYVKIQSVKGELIQCKQLLINSTSES
ncbi:hypothetical protein DdX_07903 [Ditylenchus destructor]|uniref:Uncharacterized protein n=1 Tax=Ditylenchus destructor TaxID=166010 RepID=A0AAD4R1F6_9BILA|nr:hypothetical protein DdX_07903 [Ditylenchus destructor]